jgi:hypothetical protein
MQFLTARHNNGQWCTLLLYYMGQLLQLMTLGLPFPKQVKQTIILIVSLTLRWYLCFSLYWSFPSTELLDCAVSISKHNVPGTRVGDTCLVSALLLFVFIADSFWTFILEALSDSGSLVLINSTTYQSNKKLITGKWYNHYSSENDGIYLQLIFTYCIISGWGKWSPENVATLKYLGTTVKGRIVPVLN